MTAPIIWTGDLADDCTAEWCDLMLRAECMDADYWWWAVYDMQSERTIENSNEYSGRFSGGEAARSKAEQVARDFVAVRRKPVNARFAIANTFKITGRGIVFAGYPTQGNISVGDTIEFEIYEYVRQRMITGVELFRTVSRNTATTGLLIRCNSEDEIEELRNWNPRDVAAVVYNTGGK